MTEKYIYVSIGGGLAVPSGYIKNDAGKAEFIGYAANGVTAPPQLTAAQVKSSYELELMTAEELNKLKILSTEKNSNMAKDYNSSAINSYENLAGQKGLYREESAGMGPMEQTLSVTLDATKLTADSVKVLLGDGSDGMRLNGEGVKLATDAGGEGLVIDGPMGKNTLVWLSNMANNGMMRLHWAQFTDTATGGDWFAIGKPARKAYQNLEGDISGVNVPFQLYKGGDTQQPKYQILPDFRFDLSNMTALILTLKKGDVIQLNFKLRSITAVFGQKLVGGR